MYVVKNALRCIGRAKGRNVLIGAIVLVIAVSCCLGLSIRQAADTAKQEALETLSVTASISYDRASAMEQMKSEQSSSESFDKDSLKSMMSDNDALSLSDYEKYAQASTVKDFLYSMTAYVSGSSKLEAVSSEADDANNEATSSNTSSSSSSNSNSKSGDDAGGKANGSGENASPEGGQGGNMPRFGGDFALVGYSSESSMTSFVSGSSSISDGEMFDFDSSDYECVISQELAQYNDISVGDKIKVTNTNDDSETYKLKVVGIYLNSEANEGSQEMHRSLSDDPANQILMSYKSLTKITKASAKAAKDADSDSDSALSSAIQGNLSATYSFASVEDYETFQDEVRDLGLDDSYTVSSSDVSSFENSLAPLETLSTMAGYFLVVILIIGAIILVVLNIFNVRERKYEIGVLTAMGMRKGKVALQFITEIFAVTLIAILLGAVIGAASSVPVTNSLLEGQVQSQTEQSQQVSQNFGHDGGQQGSGDKGSMDGGQQGSGDKGSMGGGQQESAPGAAVTSYVTQINSAMNLNVLLELLGIGVLLTLVSGAVSMLFVMRYEPLKILANRD